MARVLVAYASKRGGTEGIARMIAERLGERGVEADLVEAGRVKKPDGYDAVVLGSALYGGRWQRHAVRALKRIARAKARPPVWLFHSGPLGDEAADEPQAPTARVERLAEEIGADIVTFGGRLADDAEGFIAKAMVRNGKGGDWRDPEQIRGYADAIADGLGA